MLEKVDKRGSRALVKYLQRCLRRHGFDCPNTGIFCAETAAVVQHYQVSADIAVEPCCQPRMWEELHRKGHFDAPILILQKTQRSILAAARRELLTEPDGLGPKAPRARLIELSLSYLGFQESPHGSNGGEFLEDLLDDSPGGDLFSHPRRRSSPPWGPTAVHSFVLEALPARDKRHLPKKKEPLVTVADWKSVVPWLLPEEGLEEADVPLGILVSFDRHLGVVVGRVPGDDGLYVVEPNAQGQVSLRRRVVQELDGLGVWWRGLDLRDS